MSTTYVRARSGVNVLITPSATVRDDRISYRAAGVLNRLLDNAEGYGMTAEQLAAERKHEGRDAIRTALRELVAARYIVRRANRLPDGKFVGQTMYVYDTPIATADEERRGPENPLAGIPPAGKPVHKSSKSITPVRSSTKQQHAHAPAAAPYEKKSSERKRRRRHAATGLVYWYSGEEHEITALVTEYGLGAVQAAVAALVKRGVEPLQGRIAADLQSRRRSALAVAEEARKRNEANAAEKKRNDPAARTKSQAAMEEACRHLRPLGLQPPPQ